MNLSLNEKPQRTGIASSPPRKEVFEVFTTLKWCLFINVVVVLLLLSGFMGIFKKKEWFGRKMTDDNLEQKLLEPTLSSSKQTLEQKSGWQGWQYTVKNWAVDTTAAWLYWTPVMTVTEFASGMEPKEVLKSRAMSLLNHAVLGRVVGKYRNVVAKWYHADANSSEIRKAVSDITAQLTTQIPIYSTMLYFSGVSLREGLAALGTGLVIGFFSGRPFGYVQDCWRKRWGTKTTF